MAHVLAGIHLYRAECETDEIEEDCIAAAILTLKVSASTVRLIEQRLTIPSGFARGAAHTQGESR